MKKLTNLIPLLVLLFSCEHQPPPQQNPADVNQTFGFEVLSKLSGIWNGPVTSSTPLGNYSQWIVDFRPISENQISAKNELDTLNDINMSFFIALYNNEFRVCFRNGGSFNGMQRISYFLADSVNLTASESYFRFSEIIKGSNRAYTEVKFRDGGDSLYIISYTNVNNTQPNPVWHMTWSAKRQDTTSAQPAVSNFNFPVKSMTKDLTTPLEGLPEAVFYGLTGDPYPEADQPYLGLSNISYSYSAPYTPDPSKYVMLIITTQPLISGLTLNTANLIYISRYVTLASTDLDYDFNYMHPGSYYLYAIYDNDGNLAATSGDWVSTTNTNFSLSNQGVTSSSTQINFAIP